MRQKTKLRSGYTTGTCAQAAAKAAGLMLVKGSLIESVSVETPSGARLNIKIVDPKMGRNFARCGVVKYSGDDPDVTDGITVYAKVRYSDRKGISITGGTGVGVVTMPGLAIKVGEYAINPTPRRMIAKEVAALASEDKGVEVEISVPCGRDVAKQTFNSRLGIKGGISIIGTTGIVEPRSTDAYKKSLALNIDVLKAAGHDRIVLVFGYVGEKFCKESLGIRPESMIKIGDHVGFMIGECVKKRIKRVLLVGHIGKLVKVSNGQLDTNIKSGDDRLNTIARYAKLCLAGRRVMEQISAQASAEAAVDILKKNRLTKVFDMIAKNAADKIRALADGRLSARCILLSLDGEELSAYPGRSKK